MMVAEHEYCFHCGSPAHTGYECKARSAPKLEHNKAINECKAAKACGKPGISKQECKDAAVLLYETESEHEPGIICRGYECKICGSFSSATGLKEEQDYGTR
jgi:hypothetical protein